MEYRILGKTGLRVSRMGLGGIPIQRIDAEGTKALVKFLHDAGVNYIDTARGYSVSEEYLGYALEGIRQDFILATKSMARTKEAMAADIETSLKNLRTDYIDLYQIHNPSLADLETVQAPGGALEALLEAKAAGKIGHIGITLHPVELLKVAVDLPWAETIMFPYNLVETQAEELMRVCTERNIGFIDMKPLAGGAIDDPALALRHICSNPDVTLVIPGMATIEEAKQNLDAVNDASPITAEETQKIQSIRDTLGTQFCRRCNYCAPCTAGISIYSQFLFEGYYNRYNLKEWASSRYAAQSKKASDCVGCGVCETRCPYNLPIREMLKNVVKVFG
ncbi:MAG: aldo/keto reductase [Oscillospiraceae bacterium]|nr:aldo/keto reductase [Oscillospiraceae bacterium]